MSEGEKSKATHEVVVTDRKRLTAGGVQFVDSFDEYSLTLTTSMGQMTVEGQSLKIEDFSNESGTVRICGEISGYYYSEKSVVKKKLFERFMK